MMNVSAVFHGILSDWVGTDRDDFELPANASYADLLAEIGARYGAGMPSQLWDTAENNFRGPIMASGDGRNIDSLQTILKDGEEIIFLLMLSGG